MPLNQEEREWACLDMLNTYLFDRVWNEPFSEFRINIKPRLIKDMSQIGSFGVADANIELPTTTDSYYVWAISAEDFNVGLLISSGQWTSLMEVCNKYNTLIHMYGVSGHMFHKGTTFLMYNQSRSIIYIAAKKHMVKQTIAPNSQDNVYLTVYYDSDNVNKVRCLSLYTTKMNELSDLQWQLDQFMHTLENPDHLSMFINGVDVTDASKMPMVDNLTYYDFIIDENILFTFDIDLVGNNQDPVFLSEKDKTWKQLLHIPKVKNPDNKIITHNTCDFTVYRKYGDTHGLYLHRASHDRTITQVTHNDMAVPLFILDAYRDYLQTQEIRIKGAVRIHEKDNVLVRDASYIDLLYTDIHDDERIIEILCGKGPQDIPWWMAVNLEQSKYVEMMFDVPNIVTPELMDNYVKALGFYQVVNILCKRIQDVTVSDAYTGTLVFDLPTLYAGMKVIPIVYLNGRPLLRQHFTYSCDTEDNTVKIVIDPAVYTQIGDRLTVVLFVDGDNSTIAFTPSLDNLTVQVPFDDIVVYRKDRSLTTNKGVNLASRDVYVKCLQGTNIFVKRKLDEGGCRVTFSDNYAGEEFFIQSAYCSFFQSHNLEEYSATGKSIAIPAQTLVVGTKDRYVPIFDFKNVSAFLNGNYLVKGIDYFVLQTYDKDGNLAFSEIVIQTMDYFNEEGEDVLDILFNVAEIEDISHGFSIHDRLQDTTPVNLYFPNISAVHVDGQLVRNLDYRGIYIQLFNDPELNGGKFEIQTSVPRIVKDFITKYATNEDLHRIEVLNAYFYPYIKVDVDFLVMEGKHRMYSIFMNTFIHDIVTGQLGVAVDPDINRMKESLASYERLKEVDLCYKNLDQRFVDYYPQYVNYEIDASVKLVIDKYIKLFMPENVDPTLEVVYG